MIPTHTPTHRHTRTHHKTTCYTLTPLNLLQTLPEAVHTMYLHLKIKVTPHYCMLLGYRIVVCVTHNNLYSDKEIFFPSHDRILPTDTNTKPRRHNSCKQYPPICCPAPIPLTAFQSFSVLPDCPP